MVNCGNPHHGKIIYNLNILKADKFGNVAPVSTTISHVLTGVPTLGWYIAVFDGSQPSQKRIACGDIVPGGIPHGIVPPPPPIKQENPPLTNTPTTKDQLLHVFLAGSADNNQSAMGHAALSLDNNALTVTISLGLLVPNAKYVAQIYNGTCEAQGPMVFPLNTFNADKNGRSSSTTTIQSVSISSIPKAPWYINVYEAPSNNNGISQAGPDPIACGNFSMAVTPPPLPKQGTPQNSQGFVPCCKH